MHEQTRSDPPVADQDDAELKQPDEAVKDLEPDKDEGEDVKGGVSLNYAKIKYDYQG